MRLAFSDICSRRIQAGVTLHLMGKIRLQEGKPAEALARVQEAATIFKETGSRHLPEAEKILQAIQERMQRWENEQ